MVEPVKDTKPFAAVICPFHGQETLNRGQYMKQMLNSGDAWKCPKCGMASELDDAYFDSLHPVGD